MVSEERPRRGISRRAVLRGTAGAGVGAIVGVGNVTATPPDRHIVGTASAAAVREAKGRADSVRRVLDFGDVGKAVVGRFSERALENLRSRADVRYVERDGTMHAIGGPGKDAPGGEPGPPSDGGSGGGGDTSQCLPWGIDRTDADAAGANDERGGGADVAILDTGIDADHPDLEANLGAGEAYVRCRGGDCTVPWDDDNDHGTHCAGIAGAVDNGRGVVGVASGVTLHAVKVLDKRGSGSFSDIAAGIEYTAERGWDVASMSLGASSGSRAVADACEYAYGEGVLLVAAAGNSGPCSDCVGYPAAYPEVVAVSSTNSDDTLSSFSSTGPEVELAAPGGDVYSTVPGGYDTFSGTSMACPHVSGAGGVLMADGSSNESARGTLKSEAEDLGLASNESGSGFLDVAAAAGFDSSDNGTGSCT